MFLATTTVEDYERFERVFSTRAAEKRRQHGSNGAQVFRDPNDENRVWALFDWDAEGWQSFVSDPDSHRSCRRPGSGVGCRWPRPAAATTRSASRPPYGGFRPPVPGQGTRQLGMRSCPDDGLPWLKAGSERDRTEEVVEANRIRRQTHGIFVSG
jgi:hypothetical protein